MECPFCGGPTRVIDSRPMSGGIRRRRECIHCEGRFTSHERLAPADVRVVKVTGRIERFDRAKLERVVRRVARDTGVSEEALAAVALHIEAQLHKSGRTTVESWDLVMMLLPELARLHPDAHRRFLADYTDAAGDLVRPRPRADVEPAQLGLFSGEGAGS